jgi:hypothetical protein
MKRDSVLKRIRCIVKEESSQKGEGLPPGVDGGLKKLRSLLRDARETKKETRSIYCWPYDLNNTETVIVPTDEALEAMNEFQRLIVTLEHIHNDNNQVLLAVYDIIDQYLKSDLSKRLEPLNSSRGIYRKIQQKIEDKFIDMFVLR